MSENPTDSFLKMLSGKLNEKELQTRFEKLPSTLKTALRSVDSAKKVVDIGRKYALHVTLLYFIGNLFSNFSLIRVPPLIYCRHKIRQVVVICAMHIFIVY